MKTNNVIERKITNNDLLIVEFLIINMKPIDKFKKAFIKSFGLPSSR